MSRPLNLLRYIKLTTTDALDKAQAKAWRNCVRDLGPQGIVVTVSATDNDNKPQSVAMIHRVSEDDAHSYLVPLARDLSDDEVTRIVEAFAADHPDIDFDVQTQAMRLTAREKNALTLDQEQHMMLCMAMAKQQHEDWMRERSDAGWRYGPSFSPAHKTHPLLRPWDQLPDRFRKPDMDWPQKLVSMLNGQGYAVIRKDELEKIMGLIQGNV